MHLQNYVVTYIFFSISIFFLLSHVFLSLPFPFFCMCAFFYHFFPLSVILLLTSCSWSFCFCHTKERKGWPLPLATCLWIGNWMWNIVISEIYTQFFFTNCIFSIGRQKCNPLLTVWWMPVKSVFYLHMIVMYIALLSPHSNR